MTFKFDFVRPIKPGKPVFLDGGNTAISKFDDPLGRRGNFAVVRGYHQRSVRLDTEVFQ